MVAGLTGGIGSGKSTVSKIFEMLGCAVFNSDQVAKEVYYDEEVRKKVIALLGEPSYHSPSEINKSYISSKAFNNTDLLHQLNQIIHPAVRVRFNQFIKQHSNQIIIKETALLFEAHIDKEVDKIIMVACEDELRIKRVMKRDGVSESEVLKRIKSQLPQDEKIKRSHYVIHNDERELLIPQVIKIFEALHRQSEGLLWSGE
jgi:dephospho-CoA kinase